MKLTKIITAITLTIVLSYITINESHSSSGTGEGTCMHNGTPFGQTTGGICPNLTAAQNHDEATQAKSAGHTPECIINVIPIFERPRPNML
jgi:hypothetical protein